MKKHLLKSLAALAATSVVSASAADLPSRKAAPAYPQPTPMWTGFFAGLNAGGTWSNNNSARITTWPLINGLALFSWVTLNGKVASSSTNGYIGGGQIGYNWQLPVGSATFVTGLEADIQGVGANGGQKTTNALWNPQAIYCCSFWNSTTVSSNLQWLGTVRGRIGYLVTPSLLVYGTGGLAYGGLNFNFSQTQTEFVVFPSNYGPCPGSPSLSCNGPTPINISPGSAGYSATMVGYTAGGGVEWMFFPNWSLKAEYIYYNLGNVETTLFLRGYPLGYVAASGAQPGPPYVASTAKYSVAGNIARAGVNYHFNWGAAPVTADN
jgi:outer membrane immunogenic protein